MSRKYVVFMGLGVEITGLIIAGIWLGKSFDEAYGYRGFGITTGCLLALGIWIYHIILVSKALQSAQDREKEEK